MSKALTSTAAATAAIVASVAVAGGGCGGGCSSSGPSSNRVEGELVVTTPFNKTTACYSRWLLTMVGY